MEVTSIREERSTDMPEQLRRSDEATTLYRALIDIAWVLDHGYPTQAHAIANGAVATYKLHHPELR